MQLSINPSTCRVERVKGTRPSPEDASRPPGAASSRFPRWAAFIITTSARPETSSLPRRGPQCRTDLRRPLLKTHDSPCGRLLPQRSALLVALGLISPPESRARIRQIDSLCSTEIFEMHSTSLQWMGDLPPGRHAGRISKTMGATARKTPAKIQKTSP
jgi:hypothetical protein